MGVRKTVLACFAITSLLLAASAVAQPAPDEGQDDNEIVVEGERVIDIRSVMELAKTVADRPRSREPLARYKAPLCLLMAIDDPELARLIGRRIIANARGASMAIAKRGCRPNALVMIADDMRAKIERHRRSGSRFFGQLKRHQIDRAMATGDPVYVFQDIRTKANTRGQVDRHATREVIGAAVMFEIRATAGLSSQQIADYASMRIFAPSREMGELAAGTPRTIMSLFVDDAAAVAEMTRFDRAYLAALYRQRTNFNAVAVLEEAAEALEKEQEADYRGGSPDAAASGTGGPGAR